MPAPLTAGEILESTLEDGKEELGRGSAGLALSGFGAGLNVSFTALALGVVGALTGGVGLLAFAVYPLGFIFVMMSRQQLFTTNTVPPVLVVLDEDRSQLWNMLRMWGILFVANVLGALAFAFAVTHAEILPPAAIDLLLEEVAQKMEDGFWVLALKGVVGGWLVAFVVWLVAASQDTISQVFFIWAPVFLIPATGLVHCIAGSTEVMIGVFAGEASFGEFLGGFLVPATLGNVVGGVILVTLLNYGQVIGSEPDK
ncbi:MAG TPA: formate/nitrite transporter family protein [Rubrobacteraceae bacterium]|nr:formate/nitrite transporter family protein [Rubrobacteraceae bacterium]